MAKQRNIGSGVVAAARGVSAVQGRFQDVGGQFMTGFDKALESKRKKEAENKATQDRVNSYMDGFNNDIDLIKFKPEEQTLVKNKIASWRNEYADFANRAAAIKDKSSAEYQELIDNMNGIQNRMVNLKNNLDQLAAFKTEYSANIKARTYSNAGANDMSLAQGEIMLQYPIGSIGDDGNLMWSDEGTGDFNFQDYQMPFEKATGLATALGKIANPIRMQKTPLDNLQKKEIREQVDNLTRNPKALASLISDSDLPGFDFSNIDPDDPNAREKVVDLLVNSIYDLRGKGLTPSGNNNNSNEKDLYAERLARVLDTMLESGIKKTISGMTFTPVKNPYFKFKEALADARKNAKNKNINEKDILTPNNLKLDQEEFKNFMKWYNGELSDQPIFETSDGLTYTYDEMMEFLVDLKF